MLAPQGTLYISCPLGPLRIEWNAHRVFSLDYAIKLFAEAGLKIQSFSYVDDRGVFHREVPITPSLLENTCGCWYGCGIYTLVATD